MNTLERKYAEYDLEWVTFSREIRSKIVKMTFLYLMRAVTSQYFSQYVKSLTDWSGSHVTGFRNRLKMNGYLQRDLKIYIYEVMIAKVHPTHHLIAAVDRTWLRRWFRSDDNLVKALRSQCRAYKKLGYEPKSVDQLVADMNAVANVLSIYCKKFVSKSLKFVYESEGQRRDDLVNELLTYGYYAVYRAYPEIQSVEHLANIAKQAIHNRGQNVIKEATAKKRARLTKEDDGTFSSRVVSLHSKHLNIESGLAAGVQVSGMMVCTNLMAGRAGQSVNGESVAYVDRGLDLRNAVDQLINDMTDDKDRYFVELMMGVHDSTFSSWLGRDNDKLIDTESRQEYAEHVREYLNISVPRAQLLVKKLRDSLQEFVG